MKITVVNNAIENQKTDGLVSPVLEKDTADSAFAGLDRVLNGRISRLIKQGDFKPAPGSVHIVYPEGQMAAARVDLEGMGKRSELTLNRLRQAVGAAAAALRAADAGDVVICLDGLGI